MKYGAADATNSSYNENKHNITVTPLLTAIKFHLHCGRGEYEQAARLFGDYKKTTKNTNQRVSLSQSNQAPSSSPLQLATCCAIENFPQKNKGGEASKRYKGAMKIIKMLLDDSDTQLNKQEVTYACLHGDQSLKCRFLTHPKVNVTLIDMDNPKVIKSLAKTINSNPNTRKAIISNLLNPNSLLSQAYKDAIKIIEMLLDDPDTELNKNEVTYAYLRGDKLIKRKLLAHSKVNLTLIDMDNPEVIKSLAETINSNPNLIEQAISKLLTPFLNPEGVHNPNILRRMIQIFYPENCNPTTALDILLRKIIPELLKIFPYDLSNLDNSPHHTAYSIILLHQYNSTADSQKGCLEELIKELISLFPDLLNGPDVRKQALYRAIKLRNKRMVDILLPYTRFSIENVHHFLQLFLEDSKMWNNYLPLFLEKPEILKLLITALQKEGIKTKYIDLFLNYKDEKGLTILDNIKDIYNGPKRDEYLKCMNALLKLKEQKHICPVCLEETSTPHSSCRDEYFEYMNALLKLKEQKHICPVCLEETSTPHSSCRDEYFEYMNALLKLKEQKHICPVCLEETSTPHSSCLEMATFF
ncbi:hypothetical protein [Cardinium endosymbiont of Philonthus spinipes]|uniref:hypothetical protein n=1 Tax=Cardinium endosymbiont of Philonthus spinipes TaxID=3077941 RepID=UPI00313BBC03